MDIESKFEGYSKIFEKYFIYRNASDIRGANIPLSQVNFSNLSGSVGDGTINMAEYLTYLHLCNASLDSIRTVTDSINRLSYNAYYYYETMFPEIYMKHEDGFFLRDDILAEDHDRYHLKSISSGFSGSIQGINEDPCYSVYTSQDQIWNLLPILSKLHCSDAIKLMKAMTGYVVNHKHVIYNPYQSAILHYWTYLPTFDTNKVKPWDRVSYRNKKLKYNVKVKRGANNWYFSYGFKKAYNYAGGDCKTFWASLWYKPFIFLADRFWHPYICKWLGLKVKNTSYYAMGLASGAWYGGNVDKRIVKKFNKSLAKGELFLPTLAVLSNNANEIDLDLLFKWLNSYPEPDLTGTMDSPLTFMILYKFYKNRIDE